MDFSSEACQGPREGMGEVESLMLNGMEEVELLQAMARKWLVNVKVRFRTV